MQINPYLHYNGNCEEAFKFYEKAIGAKVDVIMHVEGSPAAEQMPPSMAKKVLHAQISIDGEVIMASDSPPDYLRRCRDSPSACRPKRRLKGRNGSTRWSIGGIAKMPFAATFWSKGFGMCIDKFGVPWMINTAQDCPDQ